MKFKVLFSLIYRNVLSQNFISYLRNIISLILHLSVIRKRHLYRSKIRKLYSLIVSHSLFHWHFDPQTSSMLLLIFSVISYLCVRHHNLVIRIIFLNCDIFYVWGSVRLGLAINLGNTLWRNHHWLLPLKLLLISFFLLLILL